MPAKLSKLLERYVWEVKKIYGKHLQSIILYGSYARGDYRPDSDIDIMILLDLTDLEIKDYRHQLSGTTYDINEEYNTDIKPIAKNAAHFKKWLEAYPFYANVQREGTRLF